MKALAALLLLAAPMALAQAPSGAGSLPKPPPAAAPGRPPPPQTAPVPQSTPVPQGTATPGLPSAVETRQRLEALLGQAMTQAQAAAVAAGWKTAMGEARIARGAYADRLAAVTGLYRGRLLELLPPLEQVGAFNGAALLPALEKERGLPLTREEKAGIQEADTARRAQVRHLVLRMVETYAAALARPADAVAAALSLAPAASARPSAAPTARN